MAKKINTDSFQMVGDFHKLAGHPVADKTPVKVPDIRTVRFREHFKLEEIIEGLQALGHTDSLTVNRAVDLLKQAQSKWNELQPEDLDPDLIEYADSLGDLKYVTEGAAHCYNINLSEVVEEVHLKNLTRFPAGKEELDATLEKAKCEGVQVYSEEVSKGQFVVKRVDNDKVYKNAMFSLPELGPIIGINPNS